MGWAAGDEIVVKQAKIELSQVKTKLYSLHCSLRNINHIDKGPQLRSLLEETWNKLDLVERHLSR